MYMARIRLSDSQVCQVGTEAQAAITNLLFIPGFLAAFAAILKIFSVD